MINLKKCPTLSYIYYTVGGDGIILYPYYHLKIIIIYILYCGWRKYRFMFILPYNYGKITIYNHIII